VAVLTPVANLSAGLDPDNLHRSVSITTPWNLRSGPGLVPFDQRQVVTRRIADHVRPLRDRPAAASPRGSTAQLSSVVPVNCSQLRSTTTTSLSRS